ncbi:MAG: TetR/AcrR family transcriptional regulator, partial [Acidimicrobiia bacterium]|nr:TetR/AcrR family transcriptional regulator [Acidimicrobiia bacterium]
MPRTKSFDVDEVLERAVDLFWVNGFAATSMEDLVQRLGINRGSLYGTFGSKEELYQRVLNRYLDRSVDWLQQLMSDRDRPLRQRVGDLLMSSTVSENHRGCLMVNSAAERNAVHDGTRAITNSAVERMRTILIEGLTGEELVIGSPQLAADYLIVTMQGL